MMLETTQLLANTYKSAIDRLINHLDQRFDNAVDMMLQSTGQVIVCGMGKSGLFGQKISSTLASTGTPSIFLHPAEALHGDLGRVRSNDVLLLISNSGETEEIIRLLPAFERFGIPELFPEIYFYDYTKRAARLNKTPDNYRLMFSYSGRAQYANQVQIALGAGVPIAAVFRDQFPAQFLGRPVIDGDKSDLINSKAGPVIIGLKAKGSLAKADKSGFVIDAERIPALVVAA